MTGLNLVPIWKLVIQNQNSWVLFKNGTVVIFLPDEIHPGMNIKAEAIQRLEVLRIRDVVVAELIGQGKGWIVNCGNDYILTFLEHGDYESRYDRLSEMIAVQKQDQQDLKIIHVERKE